MTKRSSIDYRSQRAGGGGMPVKWICVNNTLPAAIWTHDSDMMLVGAPYAARQPAKGEKTERDRL